MATLNDLLLRMEQTAPGHPALRCGAVTLSYGELADRVLKTGAAMRRMVTQDAPAIALLLPNGVDFPVAYFGALAAGVRVVPLSVLYRADELRFILEDAGCQVLVFHPSYRKTAHEACSDLECVKHLVVTGDEATADETLFQSLWHDVERVEPVTAQPGDDAVILYTSGTTGRPKGAVLTHDNLVTNGQGFVDLFTITPDDCLFTVLPLYHAFGATACMVAGFVAGATLAIAERFLPAETLRLLEQTRATIFCGVPAMYGLMLQVKSETEPDLSALRICVSGGAPLPDATLRDFPARFQVKMVEGYGLSEASPIVSVTPPDGAIKPGSIGCALPGVQVVIRDPDGQPLAAGEVGELTVSGPNVMCGYLNRPEATEAAIRDGWLYTGDLAYMDDDGYLFIAGRQQDLIIVGGFNVYPAEVERVLQEHPAVAECAIFGMPDKTCGEVVHAAVVLKPGADVTATDLRTFSRRKLARFKTPSVIQFMDALPKNALGKVLRRVLRDQSIS